MKKTFALMASMSLVGVASAQSNVTLFGVMDAAVQHTINEKAANGTRMTQGSYASSRIGFRGTEDLGGGLYAGFWLEAGINNDDGTGFLTNTNNQSTGSAGGGALTFNRRSTVSLGGNWGEVRLGRDFTPALWNVFLFDPFLTVGLGATQVYNSQAALPNSSTYLRASNSVGYFAPSGLGGFYGQAMYFMGENASTAANHKDGTGGGGRVGYASGPIDIAAAWQNAKYLAGNYREANIGGSYDFGLAKLIGLYERDHDGSLTGKGWQVGVTVPLGLSSLRASYSVYETDVLAHPEAKKLSFGYAYSLSKRTTLYASLARVNNSGGANSAVIGAAASSQFGLPVVNGSSTAYEFGVRHAF